MQQLDGYRRAAWQLVWEADLEMDDEARAQAERAVSAMPRNEWLKWQREHWSEIQAWMKATPKARAKRKGFQKLQPLLDFAGFQNLIRAARLLEAVDRPEFLPGGSYRRFAAGMADVYWDLATEFPRPRYSPDPMPIPPWQS